MIFEMSLYRFYDHSAFDTAFRMRRTDSKPRYLLAGYQDITDTNDDTPANSFRRCPQFFVLKASFAKAHIVELLAGLILGVKGAI